jgi:hypothetical protein
MQAKPALLLHLVPSSPYKQHIWVLSVHDVSGDVVPFCREHWLEEEHAPPIARQESAATDAVAMDSVAVALGLSSDPVISPAVVVGGFLKSVAWHRPALPPHVEPCEQQIVLNCSWQRMAPFGQAGRAVADASQQAVPSAHSVYEDGHCIARFGMFPSSARDVDMIRSRDGIDSNNCRDIIHSKGERKSRGNKSEARRLIEL